MPKPKMVYRDATVRVLARTDVKPSAARDLAARVHRALKEDAGAVGEKPGHKPVTVVIYPTDEFVSHWGSGTSGINSGPGEFSVPVTILTPKDEHQRLSDDDTIAHELGHVEDGFDRGKSPDVVPLFLQEGKGWALGNRNHIDGGPDPAVRDVKGDLKTLTVNQARYAVKKYRTAKDFDRATPDEIYTAEIVGALYVEFLRTRLGGHGKPDTLKRLDDLDEAIGRGASFNKAFQEQFGMPPAQAEDEFLAYVKATSVDSKHLASSKRLVGTIYA